MPPPPSPNTKRQTLRRHGTLNPHPETVAFPLFHSSEMLSSFRQTLRQRVRGCLRAFPSIVLSGASSPSTGRTLRPASSQARPARRPQADHRGDGVRGRAANRRCFPDCAATGRVRPETVPGSGAPSQHPTPTAAAKKTLLTPSVGRNHSDALRSSYEDLRAQALAGGRGSGFALILDHGMCEWMEVCSSCTAVVAATEPVAAVANPQLLPPGMRSEIVAILAGMSWVKPGEV